MSEVEDILADVRKRRPAAMRMGSRLALVLAGAGVVGAIAAGATLGISATASISRQGLGSSQSEIALYEASTQSSTAGTKSMPSEAATSSLAPAEAAPEQAAADEAAASLEPPTYGALTDPATIPRPPSSWSTDELANAEVWLTQQSIIADCMLQKGFEYEYSPWWMWPKDYRPGGDGVEVEYDVEAGIALDGEPGRGLGDDYDWREAGCHGYAVHVTGMDNAN